LAVGLGILCATAAIIPAWFLATDRYTATALLQVSANEQQLVFQMANRASASSFEIYKGTQQELLTSDVVLTAALARPEAASLAFVQNEDDPVGWLAENLRVDYPGKAEIMRVSLTEARPDEAAILVGAVVDAYINEVVDAERHRQRDRLDDLDRLYTEKEKEMRGRRTGLKQLAERLGTGDTNALVLKQQIALQQYAEGRNELARVRSELQRARDDLETKQVWLKTLEAASQDSVDAEFENMDDRTLTRLTEQIDEIDNHLALIRERVKEPLLSAVTAEYTATRKVLAERAATRRQELSTKLHKKSRVNMDPQIAELKSRVDILVAQEKAAVKDLDEQRRKAELVGNSSIDVEMMRNELQYLDKVLAPIAEEREKLKVELRSTPRITLIQRPSPPKVPSSKPRLRAVASAGLGGLFLPIFLVLWWDVRKQRINSLVDLSRGLGLTVVGALPRLPQEMLVRTARPSKRHRKRRDSLDHAVDSIAARLCLRKDGECVRVLMVSSAAQGEGKTTLAVQLATRLARTGERTLLVDFDLRRPSIHRIFGLPRGPGVSECIQKEFEVSQVAHPTDAENLSVITAGNELSDSLGPLANGVTTSFFEQARAAFTFVVVDGSPILPVIDGLLVSQHADTVVLSVRRDTSEAPQVVRACEKLSAFGSRKFVAVLNGSQEEVYCNYQEDMLTARIEAVDVPVAAMKEGS